MTDFIKLQKGNFSFKKFITNALAEDVGDGDHTTKAIIPKSHSGKMRLLVKEAGIIAGIEAAEQIFWEVDKKIKLKTFVKDGALVKKGDVAFLVEGNSRSLLLAERLVLNVMQRMSGIATKTHHFQNLCEGTSARVMDTRKTTPGFRFFEKWAVAIGGGANHRFGLYDMVLIKDNHIDFAGGISQAISAVQKYLTKNKKKLAIEVEVRSLQDLRRVLACTGINRIMLDNFSVIQTKNAMRLINRKFKVESSGGITEKNIRAYALCGVDFISVGALTHHVKGLDLSLKAIK